jgi:hypothetical protein
LVLCFSKLRCDARATPCGRPKQSQINKTYTRATAGFRVSAQDVLDFISEQTDIFLIDTDIVTESANIISPLLVHELCHYFVDSVPELNIEITDQDDSNAQVIVASYVPGYPWRTLEWARLLSWAARKSVTDGNSGSVRNFIEMAIPPGDRPAWDADRIIEPSRR